MGKYMRKSKSAGEMAVMEVSHPHPQSQASLGVCTRAKTLALQRSSASPVTSGSYLQLRSRRLEKPPILLPKRLEPKRQKPKASSNSRAASRLGVHGSVAKVQGQKAEEADEMAPKEEEGQEKNEHNNTDNNKNGDLGVEEASFGENVLELEGRERWVFWVFFYFNFVCNLFVGGSWDVSGKRKRFRYLFVFRENEGKLKGRFWVLENFYSIENVCNELLFFIFFSNTTF